MPLKKPSNLAQMNLLFNRSSPLQLPGGKQRALTAALDDRLLNAAEAVCGELYTEIEMEDEDASEADG
jgi:hypothetical protein